ncbi:hypothetical protein QVD17_38274 [Tagetes erecta]|uniref:Reverse transcriptase Ty1/copia-type domain-containing protein n=1 Tax=Tagetes erecta TaxID=13708 RepID=A0AAD8JVP8_TARER|nr:hypothetical protein QVD17_38274 [Tagetes erecta]
MQEELLQFRKQEVWKLVDLPEGENAIGTRWLYKNKPDERGIVVRNKARLIAQGYTQEEGIDYEEVFAPVDRLEAIRVFIAYATFMKFKVFQMDVKGAFLYGPITDDVYVRQPPCFEDPEYPHRVYKLSKALYGLHQAPRIWYETLSKHLLEHGFTRVYVDDIIFGSTSPSMCKEFEEIMKSRFQMSSMGEINFFLGLQVKQSAEGIFINQSKFVEKLLKKFKMQDCQTIRKPSDVNCKIQPDPKGKSVDQTPYRSMIGSLMYLTASRPDIMYAVCVCARYQSDPKESHLVAVKRIFRYLKGKPNLGLWYPYDFGGCALDRKSNTGGCQFLGPRLVSWQCKKHTNVSVFTAEAEYIAASAGCSQSIQCDELHRELFCCGIHRPEVSHEVSFELQGAAKDSQSWNKKSPKCGPSPNKISKEIQKIPKGNDRKLKFQNGIQKKSQSGPNPNRTQIPHCAINAVEKVNREKSEKSPNRVSMTTVQPGDEEKLSLYSRVMKHSITMQPEVVTDEAGVTVVRGNITRHLQLTVSGESIRTALRIDEEEIGAPDELTTAECQACFINMGHPPIFPKHQFVRARLGKKWKLLCYVIQQCMSRRSAGFDNFPSDIASPIVAIAENRAFNMSKWIMKGFVFNLVKGKRFKFLMYPRFLQLMINIAHPIIREEGFEGGILYTEDMNALSYRKMNIGNVEGVEKFAYMRDIANNDEDIEVVYHHISQGEVVDPLDLVDEIPDNLLDDDEYIARYPEDEDNDEDENESDIDYAESVSEEAEQENVEMNVEVDEPVEGVTEDIVVDTPKDITVHYSRS